MKKKSSRQGTIDLTEQQLLKLAGDVYFERGTNYHHGGAVVWLDAEPNAITARVQGSEKNPYLVRYWVYQNQLHWGCACPLGVDGAFCKHLVAAGLAWINDHGDALHSEPDMDVVAADLLQILPPLSREQLLHLITDRTTWDDSLVAELHLATRIK